MFLHLGYTVMIFPQGIPKWECRICYKCAEIDSADGGMITFEWVTNIMG